MTRDAMLPLAPRISVNVSDLGSYNNPPATAPPM